MTKPPARKHKLCLHFSGCQLFSCCKSQLLEKCWGNQSKEEVWKVRLSPWNPCAQQHPHVVNTLFMHLAHLVIRQCRRQQGRREEGHFPICQQVSASLASISDLLSFKNASRGKAGRAKYLLLESEVCKEMEIRLSPWKWAGGYVTAGGLPVSRLHNEQLHQHMGEQWISDRVLLILIDPLLNLSSWFGKEGREAALPDVSGEALIWGKVTM